MFRTLKLIAVTALLSVVSSAVLAAPNCPGGHLKGKITCKGLINPVCTEGPPWVCVLSKDKDPPSRAELTMQQRFEVAMLDL